MHYFFPYEVSYSQRCIFYEFSEIATAFNDHFWYYNEELLSITKNYTLLLKRCGIFG